MSLWVIGWAGTRCPSIVNILNNFLVPTPIQRQILEKYFFAENTKNFCFSDCLTTVLPAHDVFNIKTVYIWVVAKIPRPPPPIPNHPLFLSKNWKKKLLKNTNTSVFLIIRQQFYKLMKFLRSKQYISGWGPRYPSQGILAPTP